MTTLFLCGDVMTGRGIDQVLTTPSDPVLYESYVKDARDYVTLAERTNGRIRRPVAPAYIWGAALAELERVAPDARIINLETSVTRSDDPWPDKGIHYRMHPGNVGCLSAARIDCCVLANNHVLDWGYAGLDETIGTLRAAGLRAVGAGANALEAAAPAVIDLGERGRILVFGCGSATSGIPPDWRARTTQPGVNLARGLIDSGVDIVHGHSSHHAKGVEVHRQRLILYGCGDFLNDYEGIGGHETFRGDLSLMYFVDVDAASGTVTLHMVPLRMRRFSLQPASRGDAQWLKAMLERESVLEHGIEVAGDNRLTLRVVTCC